MDVIFGNTISAVWLDTCTNWLVKASRLMKAHWVTMIANASLREELVFLALKTALLWPFKKTLLGGFSDSWENHQPVLNLPFIAKSIEEGLELGLEESR